MIVTRKDVEERAKALNKKIIHLHYGIGSDFLGRMVELGYNKGIYGWNFTAYETENAIFVVGYRNFPRSEELKELDTIVTAYYHTFDKGLVEKFFKIAEAL